MRKLPLPFLFSGLFFPLSALSQEWKNECVGYYQLQLPDNVEVALYPVDDFIKPRKQPESSNGIQDRQYASPGITFDRDHYIRATTSAVQAQFSAFYYGNYKLGLSTKSKEPIDFPSYQSLVKDKKEFGINVIRQTEQDEFVRLKKSVISKEDFGRINGYLIKDYPDAFSLYERRVYTLYINKDNRLYHFWKKYDKDTGDKSQTAEKQWRDKEPEVLSLLKRFRARKLYEVPAEQGFCLPYGFIAGDSGQEKRNMAVTFRLKEHPDVTIFFQDLGAEPEAGFHRPENENAKDFVTYLWNRKYQWSSISKELISPKWRKIEMDGRKGLGTFVRSEFKNGSVDYGYVAYVQGNHNARNLEPDLLLYVMQNSDQLNGHPPMDKNELEKMAEHIISTVKRR